MNALGNDLLECFSNRAGNGPDSDFMAWCADEAYRLEWPTFWQDIKPMDPEGVDKDPRQSAVNERMKALWREGPKEPTE